MSKSTRSDQNNIERMAMPQRLVWTPPPPHFLLFTTTQTGLVQFQSKEVRMCVQEHPSHATLDPPRAVKGAAEGIMIRIPADMGISWWSTLQCSPRSGEPRHWGKCDISRAVARRESQSRIDGSNSSQLEALQTSSQNTRYTQDDIRKHLIDHTTDPM